MDRYSVATIGIENQELTILKSLLTVFSGSTGVTLELIEDPDTAQISFLGHLDPERVRELAQSADRRGVLVYCRARGEEPPMVATDGVVILDHCPPRSVDLSRVIETVRKYKPTAPTDTAEQAPQMLPTFDVEGYLAARIHATLPRLLADQQLVVAEPGAPCLLVDVRAGVRTVHAHPNWFTHPNYWRATADEYVLRTDAPPEKLAECRKYPAIPYRAMRFWGLMSATRGRPLPEIAKANTVGLRKLPDFKHLPHLAWQAEFAPQMVGKQASPQEWAARSGHGVGEVIDFLNGCTGLDLIAAR